MRNALTIAFLMSCCGQAVLADELPPLDGYGDPLPDAAVSRLGTTRLRHRGALTAAVFVPRSTMLATTGGCELCFWDRATGKLVRKRSIDHPLSLVAVSKDGVVLACTDSTSIRLIDPATGEERRKIPVPLDKNESFLSLAVSPDGEWAAAGGMSFPLLEVDANAEFKPHSKTKTNVRLYSLRTGELKHVFPLVTSTAYWLDFAGDSGRLLVVFDGKAVQSFEVESGRLRNRFEIVKEGIAGMRLLPGGRELVASDGPENFTVWNLETGERMGSRKSERIRELAVTRDGRLMATVHDGEVALRRLPDGAVVRSLPTRRYIGATFSPEGRTLAILEQQAVRLVDVDTGKPLVENPFGSPSLIRRVAVSHDGGRVATLARDNRVLLWDADTARIRSVVREEDSGSILGFDWSADGKQIVTIAGATKLNLWDSKTGDKIRTVALEKKAYDPRFTPDGAHVAVSDGSKILRILRVADGREAASVETLGTWEGVLGFSADGKLVAVRDIGRAPQILDWRSKESRPMVDFGRLHAAAVAFTPNFEQLAAAFTTGDRAWERDPPRTTIHCGSAATNEGAWEQQFDGHCDDVCLSPDGKLLAAGFRVFPVLGDSNYPPATGRLVVWETATGRRIADRTFDAGVCALAFSGDGRRLVSGSYDTTAIVWDVARLVGAEQPDKEP
ncbi:MAG: WD40 repeat domain-containing protein [Planctomycetales bacterium]